MILKLARLLSSFFRFLSLTCLQSCAITSTGRGNKCLMYDAWATFVSWTFPFSPSTFVPLYFFSSFDSGLRCVAVLELCAVVGSLPPPPPHLSSFFSISPFKMVGMPSPRGWCKRWAKHFSTFGLSPEWQPENNIGLHAFFFLFFHHTQLFRFSFSVENSWGILGRFLLFLLVWINRFRFCVRALPSST